MARAIRTPPPLLPSEWAEQYRYLPPSMTAEPGPWRNERTPYLAGLMDATVEPGVESVVFLKAVQVGFSEALRNLIGYWIDHDPGPAMMVLPDQRSSEEMMDERIRPLIQETPSLSVHLSGDRKDDKRSAIRLDTMSLFMAWAGSPQSLASRPIRRIVYDEVDKYPPFSGREADPISLGDKRLTTYGHRSLSVKGSTPTTRLGNVWTQWELATDRRHFHVPCPHCGHKQRLEWDRVKWPERIDGEERESQAERIEAGNLARYECESCEKTWTNDQKNAAVRDGEWISEDPNASNRRIGFQLNSIYSPWVSISKLAGEFLRSHNHPARLMDFTNSRLAKPFEQQASTIKDSVMDAKVTHAGPPMVLPEWGRVLIATADVQKDHLYYAIRAWGHGYRSQLVRYGMAPSFAELGRLAFEMPMATSHGEAVVSQVLMVDCRYRSDEVYQFAQNDPARIWPLQGDANYRAAPITERRVKEYGVIRRTINPNYWKDILHGFMTSDDETQWLPHSEVDQNYKKQMQSEHKIHDPKSGTWAWVPVAAGRDNHYWDCEVYQCVGAQLLGVAMLPSPEQEQKSVEVHKQRQASSPPRDNWIYRNRGRYS